MANANPQKDISKEILNRLTVLDKKADDDRKEAVEFRQKTEGSFTNLIKEIGGIGSMLYDNIEGNHKEFLKFQQETFFFQKRTEDFQQQTLAFQQEMRIFKQQALDFQTAMHNTVQHITRVLERIERNLAILENAYEQLKIETERLKNENAVQNATIKKLEQRLAQLEAAQSLP
jgi:chromosome segregation ATPase